MSPGLAWMCRPLYNNPHFVPVHLLLVYRARETEYLPRSVKVVCALATVERLFLGLCIWL